MFDSTVKSPHILELSGIGSRSILEAAKVPVQVDLPTVGENLQDHIVFGGSMWRGSFIFCSRSIVSD